MWKQDLEDHPPMLNSKHETLLQSDSVMATEKSEK